MKSKSVYNSVALCNTNILTKYSSLEYKIWNSYTECVISNFASGFLRLGQIVSLCKELREKHLKANEREIKFQNSFNLFDTLFFS